MLAAALSVSGCVAWISPCAWTEPPDEQPLVMLSGSSNLRWRPGGLSQASDARFRTEVWSNGYQRNLASVDHDWCRTIGGEDLAEVKAAAREIQEMSRELDAQWQARTPIDPAGESVILSVWAGSRFVHSQWASLTSSTTSPRALAAMDRVSCSLERTLSRGYRRAVQKHLDDYLKARGRAAPCAPSEP